MSESIFEGVRVIVTRPVRQAKPWRTLLGANGIESVSVPVLAIEPVQTDAERQAVKNHILEFDNFSKAIFVSQNAARYGLEWLDRYWPQLPDGVDYYAIGSATAKLLATEGIAVQCADSAMNSEALLALLEGHIESGEKIAIFRGCGGRTHLGDSLVERGCQVSYIELYQRLLPPEAVEDMSQLQLSERDVVSVHSGESLENLLKVLQQVGAKNWSQLALLVPGERVATLAAKYGFQTVIEAENATDDAMFQALKRWCKRRQIKREDEAAKAALSPQP